jgi:hypothetical protein
MANREKINKKMYNEKTLRGRFSDGIYTNNKRKKRRLSELRQMKKITVDKFYYDFEI